MVRFCGFLRSASSTAFVVATPYHMPFFRSVNREFSTIIKFLKIWANARPRTRIFIIIEKGSFIRRRVPYILRRHYFLHRKASILEKQSLCPGQKWFLFLSYIFVLQTCENFFSCIARQATLISSLALALPSSDNKILRRHFKHDEKTS